MKPENARMKQFLADNNVVAVPKWLPDGSLKRCWRLYGKGQIWTRELAQRLNDLGFVDFDHWPLSKFSGNGGAFSVFVRGHEELLNSPIAGLL